MKITIFGGGGFIGSTIADRLLKDGHQLRIFERPRVEPYRQFLDGERVEWLTGDLMSVHDVSSAIDDVDVILHLVSTTLPKNSNDDPIYDVQSNLVATLQLLNAMVAKQVRKIVFISSGGTVYGNPVYLPIDEKHPTEPRVSYGITKLAIEKYLLMYQELHGINANILRVANPFGERQRVETAQGAVGVFLSKAIQNQPIEIWGDGSVTRDYLYVSDVAEAFALAVNYEGTNSVFNISSGVGTSLNDMIVLLEKVLGREVIRHYQPGRPFDVPISVLDNSLARQELGWEPKVRIEDGIVKTAAWMRKVLNK
ncbi:NAD-dependent epimerase/dehydratase family protein [Methylobacter sp. S3L5C]|uniref:NAD-dependent epimerase/dehydratase family protein n=1 Tax=Methylobacter sp. S3L5C TaxID=2839024 RepID=UPI001FAC176A|nr:NAD-dependent epimerase/dehydratase family protein [Methylobacter sp. S3L5C]UOA09530.1 NAD-dependent epimerase/dehydratase family protein [Methylobacter sp. S3L5C]